MDRSTAGGLKFALLLLAAICALPAAAQVTAEDVHESERARFGFGDLRQGADGNDPAAPNAANNVEAQVGAYVAPPLFETAHQQTASGWPARRAELARMVEDNWAGRIPAVVDEFRIEWIKTPLALAHSNYTLEEWEGRITTSDGRSGPVISATIAVPQDAQSVPSLINYTYMWPGGVTPNFGGPPPPDARQQALDHGWAYAEYRPQMLQADSAAQMQEGIIGLARWPRQQHDWGALRAWAWGASQLRAELGRDPRFNPARISLTGHSRFGKGVLVAAAFDLAFHDAHVSSSGAGGAKLMRRDFGERWENMASSGAFHWFTPNIMNFARGDLSVHDLPIDAHSLIALRAPRPLFITSGLAEKGDSWVDPKGMWAAYSLAQPAWEVFGANTPPFGMPVPESREQIALPLAWYQHGEGHVPWPAYDEFYDHAEMFFDD